MAMSMELINPANGEAIGVAIIESMRVKNFFGYGDAYASNLDKLNSKEWVKCQIEVFTALNSITKRKHGAL